MLKCVTEDLNIQNQCTTLSTAFLQLAEYFGGMRGEGEVF